MSGNITSILGHSFTPTDELISPGTQLWQELVNAGFDPPPDIVFGDDKFYRWGKNDRYWCKAFSGDIPTAVFGDYVNGKKGKVICDTGKTISQLERFTINKRLEEAIEEAKKRRNALAEHSAIIAEETWDKAKLATVEHPYIIKKQIKPHGTRVADDTRLMVPMYRDGDLVSMQYISLDSKRPQKGTIISGAYSYVTDDGIVSEVDTDRIFIAEGFATAATIYEETGIATAISFSSGNMPKVAADIRGKHSTARITIVADLDEGGAGEIFAHKAALSSGANVIVSPVSSDVNDYRMQGGDVRAALDIEKNTYERMQVFSGDSIDADAYTPPDEIVEDIITSNTLSMLYGESHSGKTFFAVALAAAISQGSVFFDKHTDKGNVIYLATEAPRTVRDRLQAMKKYQNADLSNFFVVPMPLNFYTNHSDVIDVIALCKEIGNVKLVIGDTLARMSAGANENTGEDMGPVLERFDVLAREAETAVMIIHHSGKNKDRGSRGWSGMPAHIDAEIEITNTNTKGSKTATITKQRELGTTGMEIPFKITPVEMGIGKFGSMKTSCIVEVDNTKRDESKPKRSKKEEFFRYFEIAWERAGRDVLDGNPYITRSALKNIMTEDKYKNTERSIDNELSPSYATRFIGTLMSEMVIKPFLSGWIVIDPVKSFALLQDVQAP